MKWPLNWRDGGLLKGKQRIEQHNRVQKTLQPDTPVDDIMKDVFNVVIELRVNADNLEDVLRRLKAEENDE